MTNALCAETGIRDGAGNRARRAGSYLEKPREHGSAEELPPAFPGYPAPSRVGRWPVDELDEKRGKVQLTSAWR